MRSNTGRLPSVALAVGITIAMLALVVATNGRMPAEWWHDVTTRPTSERITYVRPAPAVPAPITPAPRADRATGPARTAPLPPVASPRPATGAGTGAPIAPARADTGSAGTRPGPTRIPGIDPTVGRSAPPLTLPSGRTQIGTVSVPLTGAQQDSALRATIGRIFDPKAVAEAVRMAADAKARGDDEARRETSRAVNGSAPYYHGLRASIPAFGGLSPAERRKRDSIDREIRGRLENVEARAQVARARADSLRRRDSIRLALDSGRTSLPARRDSLE